MCVHSEHLIQDTAGAVASPRHGVDENSTGYMPAASWEADENPLDWHQKQLRPAFHGGAGVRVEL
jgi:hypothetical protein